MSSVVNFFGRTLNGYKTNLHSHSKVSDGYYTPQELIKIYADAGYDAFAFADHDKANLVSTYDGHGMTLLSGIEMHPMGPRNIIWHILAIGVPEDFTFDDYSVNPAATGQDAVDAALAHGAAVFCAHPYWCGLTMQEVASLKGILGIEVYNTCCRRTGRGYSMQTWDELLDAGFRYNAIAVDDVHSNIHLFMGYTVIIAEDNKPESLISALKNGSFYASQGPEFKSITVENNVLKAEFSPVTTAIAMLRPYLGRCFATPNAMGPGADANEVTSLELDLSQYKDNFVRIQLCDKYGRMAWSNPVFIP